MGSTEGSPFLGFTSSEETRLRESFGQLFRTSPIPEKELLSNLGLFLDRQTLSRILYMHDLYMRILEVPGIVIEFGVRWGQNLALFSSFRGMYEPYNHSRKVIGFDTFEGFPSVHAKDGSSPHVNVGAYSVVPGYENFLAELLEHHEQGSPLAHIRKFALIKGDASETFEHFLSEHPETIIALAYFDMDIYEPTKRCLELLKPHLTKGSVLAFDELSYPPFPGETRALQETFGIGGVRLQRTSAHGPYQAFATIE